MWNEVVFADFHADVCFFVYVLPPADNTCKKKKHTHLREYCVCITMILLLLFPDMRTKQH